MEVNDIFSIQIKIVASPTILTIMLLAFLVSNADLFLSQKSHDRVKREIALQLGIRVAEVDIEENAQQF